jgi:uncharacterized membrane protein YhaH (DUF805 family)
MDNIDWGWLLFQFDGRINRAKFWLVWVVLYVFFAIVWGVAFRSDSSALVSLAGLLGLASIWPYLAVGVKRYHDHDKSGWWLLVGLIPLIGFFWLLIELGFLAGTDGPNQYGPDPLAASAIPEV